jgi:hypothetical protein
MTAKSIIAIAALLAANASMAGDITWNQGGDPTLGSFVSTGVMDDIFGWYGGVGLDAGGTAVFVTGMGITNVTLDGAAFTYTPYNAMIPALGGEWSLTAGSLNSGAHQIQVFGTGTYSGYVDLVQAPTAVPEPETYAMFIAGLSALGFVARRRRSA